MRKKYFMAAGAVSLFVALSIYLIGAFANLDFFWFRLVSASDRGFAMCIYVIATSLSFAVAWKESYDDRT